MDDQSFPLSFPVLKRSEMRVRARARAPTNLTRSVNKMCPRRFLKERLRGPDQPSAGCASVSDYWTEPARGMKSRTHLWMMTIPAPAVTSSRSSSCHLSASETPSWFLFTSQSGLFFQAKCLISFRARRTATPSGRPATLLLRRICGYVTG